MLANNVAQYLLLGADGKLNCTRCKRSFNKERVFNAHKCLAVSDYIDLSNTKDLVKENRENLGKSKYLKGHLYRAPILKQPRKTQDCSFSFSLFGL